MVTRQLQRWLAKRAAARAPVPTHGHPELRALRTSGATRTIGVFVYPGVTTTEIDTPVAALAEKLAADVVFVAREPGSVTGIEPVRIVVVDESIEHAPSLDVLVLPGGLGWERLVDDADLMRWVGATSQSARGIFAISTGSLILGAAGRLVGKEATGHWLAREQLASLGANVTTARTASSEDNLLVTASGAMAAMELVDEFADRVRWGP